MSDIDAGNWLLSRRAWLGHYAGSLGPLALAHLLATTAGAEDRREPVPSEGSEATPNGEAAVSEPARPRAKSVICLFQHGGPSQMDLFDPKPALNKYHGQPYPAGEVEAHFDKQKGN
ncbi:MAG: DUF1501 domain-containing protein, partial [Planctomycetaceae bacterium]